jgi:hypothetical protein
LCNLDYAACGPTVVVKPDAVHQSPSSIALSEPHREQVREPSFIIRKEAKEGGGVKRLRHAKSNAEPRYMRQENAPHIFHLFSMI